MTHIITILTSHNRRELTLACLRRLEATARHAGIRLTAVLVDDASQDGTPEAVAAEFDWVTILRGNGNLYWNYGMHIAFDEALRQGADAYLWLNDDTHLLEDAMSRLLFTRKALERKLKNPVVLVGTTADKVTGEITYGGCVARSRLFRFSYRTVWDALASKECDVMNGNCVLIPDSVARQVGNIDPFFEHAMGDTDYALRLRKSGFRLFVAPGIMGHCSPNPVSGTFVDASLPLRQRWKLIMHRKGLPPRSWLHFIRRHGGLAWPMYFAWPYTRLVLGSLLRFKI